MKYTLLLIILVCGCSAGTIKEEQSLPKGKYSDQEVETAIREGIGYLFNHPEGLKAISHNKSEMDQVGVTNMQLILVTHIQVEKRNQSLRRALEYLETTEKN